jgi:hypothetical protein
MSRAGREILEDLLSFDDLAVFMKAFFDESGKHETSEVLTMAGIVAPAKSWRKLQKRWMDALGRLRIASPFHASDCEVARKGTQFEGMSRDNRDEIQLTLIDTLKGLNIIAAAGSVLREHYTDEVATELRPSEGLRKLWFLSFEMSIGDMMARTKVAGKTDVLTLVFDRQDEFETLAHELYAEILEQDPKPSYCGRLGTLAFSPKDKVPPLQAIDLIAYEANRHVWEHHLAGNRERWQSERIRKAISIGGLIMDKDGITELRQLVKEDRDAKAKATVKEPGK